MNLHGVLMYHKLFFSLVVVCDSVIFVEVQHVVCLQPTFLEVFVCTLGINAVMEDPVKPF